MSEKNEERKLENHILWFIVAMLILILFALISTALFGEAVFQLLDKLIEPISIFTGALIGALVTGKVANDIHKKQFDRLEIEGEKASYLVRKILFYYTGNIGSSLQSAKGKSGVIDIYAEYLKSDKKSENDKQEIEGLIAENVEGIKKNFKDILREYNELCEVDVQNLDLEYLMHFLKYRSDMRNIAIPVIEKSLKNETLTKSDYEIVHEINTEFLKVNNM